MNRIYVKNTLTHQTVMVSNSVKHLVDFLQKVASYEWLIISSPKRIILRNFTFDASKKFGYGMFDEVDFIDCDFSGCNLDNTSFQTTTFLRCKFTGTRIMGAGKTVLVKKMRSRDDGGGNFYDWSAFLNCTDAPVGKDKQVVVSKVRSLHKRVYQAIERGRRANKAFLEMCGWHGSCTLKGNNVECGTTHCHAGWINTVAGKLGEDLERVTNPRLAAIALLDAAYPGQPIPDFHDTNAGAMRRIKRLARVKA